MISSALTVGQCELRVGTRNRWVLLAASILLLFALVLGFLGSGPTGTIKTDPLVVTVASLATLSVYLVPLIALLLSYDAIAGEIDRTAVFERRLTRRDGGPDRPSRALH